MAGEKGNLVERNLPITKKGKLSVWKPSYSIG
jgi:hypothetical protein